MHPIRKPWKLALSLIVLAGLQSAPVRAEDGRHALAENLPPLPKGPLLGYPSTDPQLDPLKEFANPPKGYGNVPFHRTEFTANAVTAFFSIDVGQIRAYALGAAAERLLMALSLWKIGKLLESGLRLRTACDFELVDGLHVARPAGFTMPQIAELERELPGLISDCANQGLFPTPPMTELVFDKPRK